MGVKKTACSRGHARSPDNLDKYGHCRTCKRAASKVASRKWKDSNPDHVRQYGKTRYAAWKVNNPEKWKENYTRHNLKQYGLTLEEFYAMIESQKNLCAICKAFMEKPCVDHCHRSGKVREILCGQCNVGLGCFKDDVAFLQAAQVYLRAHQEVHEQ